MQHSFVIPFAVAALTCAAAGDGGVTLPDGFEIEDVATGFVAPLDIAFAPDGRIFVAEQESFVRVIENGKVLEEPFVDLTLASATAGQVPADDFRVDFWVPDEPVRALAVSAGAVYIGGTFEHVGAHTGAFGVVDSFTASVVTGIPQVEGQVWSVRPDGAGGWYVGGDFASIGGTVRRNLAHVSSDGTLDDAWAPVVAGEIRVMVRSESTLYVGGIFNGIDGVGRENLAAIDLDSGDVLPWDPGPNDIVSALAIAGSTVYVGGSFQQIANVDRSFLASVDALTGEVDPWDPAPDSGVAVIEAADGAVYVGGTFSSIAGATRRRIASFDGATGLLNAWDPDADGHVRAIAVKGTVVYLGGGFESIGGEARLHGAAVDAETGQVLAWAPDAEGNDGAPTEVYALACTETGAVIVGGSFTSLRGVPRLHLALVDAQNGTPAAWVAHAAANENSAYVSSVAVSGAQIAVGGTFLTLGGEPRQAAAALDPQSGAALPWNPRLVDRFEGDVSVWHVLASDAVVYVAGSYDDEFNRPQPLLLAVDAISGEPMPGFAAPSEPEGSIATDLAVLDDVLYAAFRDGEGFGENGIFKYDAATGALLGQVLSATNHVLSLELSPDGSVLYFGGKFGSPRRFAGALTTADGQLTAWDPDPDDDVYALRATSSEVYIGGSFLRVGGESRRRLAAVDTATGARLDWDPDIDRRWVNALELLGPGVVVGGDFDQVGDEWRHGLAVVDRITADATAWAPSPNGEVVETGVGETGAGASILVVGGEFGAIGERPWPHLAVFDLVSDCPADLDDSGAVGFADLLQILANWGPYQPCPPFVSEDLDENCEVDFGDILILLTAWGPCV